MPTVSAMMLSARRTERTPEGGGGVGKTARFHPDTACGGVEAGLEEDSGMDYSDVNDYWFDWVQLDKAEAKARSRSMPASRSREGARSGSPRGSKGGTLNGDPYPIMGYIMGIYNSYIKGIYLEA
ncbi:RABF1 [Symbiodinium sp. CCMP2592]|nr:RABF1 [Symbiodinium sp. CCMP2592]